MQDEWPCDANEMTRRLGIRLNKHNVERVIRPMLIELGCPKMQGHYKRARFAVDEEMMERVRAELPRVRHNLR